jgi:hypothetical protein
MYNLIYYSGDLIKFKQLSGIIARADGNMCVARVLGRDVLKCIERLGSFERLISKLTIFLTIFDQDIGRIREFY